MPSSRTHLLTRASCGLAIFSALLGSTAPSPLYPIYIRHLGLSEASATALFAIYALGTLGILLLAPRLMARGTGPRAMLVFGLAMTMAGALIFAAARVESMLFLGRFLNGVGTGAITGVASAALYDLTPASGKSRVAMLVTLVFTGGAAGGPLMTAGFLGLGLAPTVSPFLAIAGFAALALSGLVLGGWPASAEVPPEDEAAPIPLATQAPHGWLWLAFATIAMVWMLGSLLMASGANLGLHLYGLQSASIAGLIPAIFQVFGGVGQAVWGRKPALRAIAIGLLGLGLAQLALLAALPGAHGLVLLLTMPVAGFCYGAAFVGGLSLVITSARPEERTRTISNFYVVGYLANSLPTIGFGVMSDRLGLAEAFLIYGLAMAALALTVGAMALLMRAGRPLLRPLRGPQRIYRRGRAGL